MLASRTASDSCGVVVVMVRVVAMIAIVVIEVPVPVLALGLLPVVAVTLHCAGTGTSDHIAAVALSCHWHVTHCLIISDALCGWQAWSQQQCACEGSRYCVLVGGFSDWY